MRDQAGWSQGDLATRLGEKLGRKVDPTTITRLEKGTRPTPLDEAQALAQLLGSSLDEMTAEKELVAFRSRVQRLDTYLTESWSEIQKATRLYLLRQGTASKTIMQAISLGFHEDDETIERATRWLAMKPEDAVAQIRAEEQAS